MVKYDEYLVRAKYHLTVSNRLIKGYFEVGNKGFLVGLIKELARSVSNLIKSVLIFEGISGKNPVKNIKIFVEKIGPKYLENWDVQNLFKILEVERAQKISPIEFSKKDNIILLIDGKYRFLKLERLKEFIKSVDKSLNKFSIVFRQV